MAKKKMYTAELISISCELRNRLEIYCEVNEVSISSVIEEHLRPLVKLEKLNALLDTTFDNSVMSIGERLVCILNARIEKVDDSSWGAGEFTNGLIEARDIIEDLWL